MKQKNFYLQRLSQLPDCMLGYGRHFWNIDPTKIVALLKVRMCYPFLHKIRLISILTQVVVLVWFQTPLFRKFTMVNIVFTVLSGLTFNFVILLQCKPIRGAWDWTVPRSQCINMNAAAYANAGIGITQDLAILLMPIPNLLKLQMDYVKKLNIIFLFSLGAL